MWFFIIWVHVSWFTCSLELPWVIFHLKLSLRIVFIMVLINDPSSSFIPFSGAIYFLVNLLISIQFFFPWVAGCHLIIWVVLHKILSSLFFSLLVFQQLRSSICYKRAPSRSCFPSLIPFYSFVPESWWCFLFSLIILDSVLFVPIHLTGMFCPFAQVLLALSSLASLFNRSAARIWSSLIPFLNRSVFYIYLPFNLKVFAMFCPSFLTKCFRPCSPSLYSFLEFVQPLKARGFSCFSKNQFSFTYPLSLMLPRRCHSRSRDEILS